MGKHVRIAGMTLAGAWLAGAAGCGGPAAAVRWDPAHATPGIVLTLTELRREPVGGKTDVAFRLTAAGNTSGKPLRVWHRPRGGAAALVPGVYLAESGKLMSSAAGTEAELHAYGLARGEVYDLAALAADGSVAAYVRRVPFPLEAREGGRRISAELGSANADTWMVQGEGFAPHEELNATLQSGDDVHLDVVTAGPDGTFTRMLFPATQFKRSAGTAGYKVVCSTGTLVLNFRWGAGALTPE